jgi:Tol biopolymer transport system component
MSQDGAQVIDLSDNRFCDRSPVWSPDGSKLAFLSDRSGDWDVWVMNADGSGQRRLAGNVGLDCAPAWSPDGQRFAWESHVAGLSTIWVCDADGRNSRPLFPPGKPVAQIPFNTSEPPTMIAFSDNSCYLRNPAWSPDSKRIAAAGIFNVIVADADGSRLLEAIHWMMGLSELVWSPDGTQLAGTMRTGPAETERSGIFVVKPGEKRHRWLVDVGPTGPRLGGAQRHGLNTWYSHGSAQPRRVVKTFASLTWLSDGDSLSFSSDMDASGAFYVYRVPADGGTPQRLDATKSAWINELCWRSDTVR